MKYPGVQKGAHLDFQKVISLIPKGIPPDYTTPGGSRKGSEEHRKALKSVDFQCFFFLVKLQDNAEYYLQACTKRVHRVSCTKMYTVTRKGLQQVEDCAFAEIQL